MPAPTDSETSTGDSPKSVGEVTGLDKEFWQENTEEQHENGGRRAPAEG